MKSTIYQDEELMRQKIKDFKEYLQNLRLFAFNTSSIALKRNKENYYCGQTDILTDILFKFHDEFEE